MGALRQGLRVRTLFVALTMIVLSAVPAAPSGWITIYESSNHGDIFIDDTGGPITVDVVVEGLGVSLDGVGFMLTIPDCPGLTLVDVSYGSNLHLGSIDTGVSVAFVGCKNLPHVAATLTFQSTGISECCYLEIEPHPQSTTGEVEGWDCSSNTVVLPTAVSAIAPVGSGFDCGAPTVPENPSPPDGAVDQPLYVALSWDSEFPLGTGLCCYGGALYFGTSTNPPRYQDPFFLFPPCEMGPLIPNTTYYWRIVSSVQYGTTSGPLWQFTTTDPIAVETTTWSRVKALYR